VLSPTLALNDTAPAYYAPWYPRNEMVFLNFFSNVDGMGIPFANLHVELNGVPLTTSTPVIPSVLYRLNITDFRGRALSDVMYNLNTTGIYVNIGLDIAVMIYVMYYSTLDAFGFDFSLAKLYIDGVRCPIFNPIMDHEIILFTVRDFANRVLYNNTWNLTVSGVYVSIPLAITTMVVSNDFSDRNVIFHYAIAGVENSFPIKAGKSIDVRVALGTYSWYITDTHNRPIEDSDGDDVGENKAISGPDFVDFGWVTVVPPPPPAPVADPNVWAYVTVIVAAVAAFGIVITLRIPKKARVQKEHKQVYPGVHTH
jgi:hypothetical protein